MRILAPAIVDPETHRGGAGTVMRALARVLSERPLEAEIHFVCPRLSPRLHRLRQVASLLRSFGSPLPAKAHFVRTGALRREVARRLREEPFDQLLLMGSDLLWLLDDLPTRPATLLVAFDTEHALYRSQIDGLGVPSPLLGPLRRDCEKLERLEETSLARVDAVICVSRDEARAIRKLRADLPIHHVPPLFDAPRVETPARGDRSGVLEIGFLGNLEWWPNRSGLAWFLHEVFPHVGPEVRLHLFGQASQHVAHDDPRLVRHGFVPDLADVWRRCDFMICPISEGAGVCVKAAETLYHRVPVLARPFAIRGLGLERDPDPAIAVLHDAADWIAFLGSPKARDLAARRVAPSTADRFAAAHHARALQAFVAQGATSREERLGAAVPVDPGPKDGPMPSGSATIAEAPSGPGGRRNRR